MASSEVSDSGHNAGERSRTALTNRRRELDRLRQYLRNACQSKGDIILLHGEAGVGKTRLLLEAAGEAQSLGMTVLSGRSRGLLPSMGMPSYFVWSEVIREYLKSASLQKLREAAGYYPQELSKMVPEFAEVLVHLRPVPKGLGIWGWVKGPSSRKSAFDMSRVSLGAENERIRMYEAVTQLIINISRQSPTLITLDDLQSADESSLSLLHYLSRVVPQNSILLLGAYREEEMDEAQALHEVITELHRERLAQLIPLGRMSLDDTVSMLGNILDKKKFPGDVGKLVYARTAGNPFFVEEVLRSLIEDGYIRFEGDQWKFGGLAQIRLPESVREIILRRLKHLNADDRQLLAIASVVGREFNYEILVAATGLPEHQLLESLERLIKTGLVKEQIIRDHAFYAFSDFLIHDVVQGELSQTRRRRLHAIIGEKLEEVYAHTLDEHFSELAQHFLEAGNGEKALDYFLRAGKQAMNVYGYHEASASYMSALKILEEKPEALRERASVLEALGDTAHYTGDYEEALHYWSDAIEISSSLGDSRKEAELHIKKASLYFQVLANEAKASEEHSAALAILEGEPQGRELGILLHDIGHLKWHLGKYEESKQLLDRALKIAQELGDEETVAKCYTDLAIVIKDPQKEVELQKKALKMALEHSYVELALRLYNNLGVITKFFLGDFATANEYHKRGLELGAKSGHLALLSKLSAAYAGDFFFQGDYQNAIRLSEDGLDLDRRTGQVMIASNRLAYMGLSYLRMGDLSKSEEAIRTGLELVKGKPAALPVIAWLTLILGNLHLERAEYEEAENCFRKCEKMYEPDKFQVISFVYPLIGRLYLFRGETEKARQIIDEAYEYAFETHNRAQLPEACMLRGMSLRSTRNWGEAREYFERSVQLYDSLNARKWLPFELGETQYEYGLLFIQRGEQGDLERAWAKLDEALEIYRRIGARGWAEKVLTLKRASSATRHTSSTDERVQAED